VATLEDLEARVAALEASQADYGAVLAAVNALGANQHEMAMTQREHSQALAELKTGLGDTNARVRSLEDGVGEIKDLLVRALDRPQENLDWGVGVRDATATIRV
jgi:chromosome segregation ATPase